MNDTKELLEAKLKLLREREELMADLPHLYGWPWYPWAKQFFDSTNRMNLLCAANQISKSSTQLRKMIHWATAQELWPSLWDRTPNQFWYLYPSKEVATVEWEKKIEPEFMPRGNKKNSAYYGWEVEYDHKFVKAIHFHSGVSVYFKTYAQDPKTLQSGSVYAIFCDEELPEHLYDELKFRLAGTRGYFHMVFTATLNQELWWRAIEAQGTAQEKFPNAFKLQISMYDCLKYLDGSATPWNVDRIKEVEEDCKSEAEKLRRVHGRFIKEEGRTFHAFDPTRHFVEPFAIPDDWQKVVGVDIGSGGNEGHPSSIIFVAIRPDYRYGVIYKGWRGDGVQTTSGDVIEKYKALVEPHEHFMFKKFDYAAKDFGTIANRFGLGFSKADKSKDLGEDIINTLYKNNMLQIFDNDDELRKLGVEMINLQKSTPKTKAKDDFCDAQRYAVIDVPWDFTWIESRKDEDDSPKKDAFKAPKTEEELREYFDKERQEQVDVERGRRKQPADWDESFRSEIAEWNEMYGN